MGLLSLWIFQFVPFVGTSIVQNSENGFLFWLTPLFGLFLLVNTDHFYPQNKNEKFTTGQEVLEKKPWFCPSHRNHDSSETPNRTSNWFSLRLKPIISLNYRVHFFDQRRNREVFFVSDALLHVTKNEFVAHKLFLKLQRYLFIISHFCIQAFFTQKLQSRFLAPKSQIEV